MSMLYRSFFGFAKSLDPEDVHDLTLNLLQKIPQLAKVFPSVPQQETSGFNFSWRSPIGIAAGLDKNARTISFWDNLGIGCLEVGTVTPKAQLGNERPRIKRIEPESLINSMGFPNLGAAALLHQIKNRKKTSMKLWVNIGKQKDTSIENAHQDYGTLLNQFSPYADAIVVNISSPNTANLRQLQQRDYLIQLLSHLNNEQSKKTTTCPLILKISPDQDLEFYQELPSLLEKYKWQGLIATNTSTNHQEGKGGISGKKIFQRSLEVANMLAAGCEKNKIDLIFAGGLSCKEDFKKVQSLGIKFAQIYTALIYQGPSIFSEILKK